MNQIQNKYVILGSLCALVLTLVVGYAAFSTVLKIKGTSNINSNWDIQITNIIEGEKTGAASTTLYKEGEKAGQKIMTFENTSATFSSDLQAPGDSIEYIITVTNAGTLDAKLDKITISEPDNEYITFETSGLVENEELKAGTNKELKVKVTFKDVNINKMEPSTSKLTVTLDFSQADGSGSVGPIQPDYTGVLYSRNILSGNDKTPDNNIKLGDTIEKIKGYTDDYTTLGSNFFLKHVMNNGQVESNHVCFLKDGLHCLIGGDGGAVYETNKSLLLSVFDATCNVTDSSIYCNDDLFDVGAESNGTVNVTFAPIYCYVGADGDTNCNV